MNQQEQLKHYNQLNEEITKLAISKGGDYGNEDVLSNFKQVSLIVKELRLDIGTPEGYALLLVILKIARLANLLAKGKTPNNESIEDSFKDGINYFKLAYMCHVDKPEERKPISPEEAHLRFKGMAK